MTSLFLLSSETSVNSRATIGRKSDPEITLWPVVAVADTMALAERDAVRSSLLKSEFSASTYLENEFRDLDFEEFEVHGELEENLTLIFDGLVHELAIAADGIESEVIELQSSANLANEDMSQDLGKHLDTLNGVQEAVNSIKMEFDKASEGAVKIGDRLTTSVEEKRRIMYGMELIDHINWFKAIDPNEYEVKLANGLDALKRDALPTALAQKEWGYISLMLSDMRRVLYDISEEGAQFAVKNVFRLSEQAEKELLEIFLLDLDNLMDSPGDERLTNKCKELVKWLHLYNNGQTLLKRYIFAVIEKRMPERKFNYNLSGTGVGGEISPSGTGGRRRKNSVLRRPSANRTSLVDRSSRADGGADSETKADGDGEDGERAEDTTVEDLDYLSQLFTTIQEVCTEQFRIIRDIFPTAMAPKVTRILIQRIYNDPAFGIQGRVDAVLQPKPPQPALLLADYLENLGIVKEKLGALYQMLLELCSHPSFQGIGRDNWNTIHAQISKEISGHGFAGSSALPVELTGTASSLAAVRDPTKEVEEFLEEQIMQVLSVYLVSYFDKEILHLRNSFADLLRKAIDRNLSVLALQSVGSRAAHNMVVTGSGLQAPRLKAEKVGGIAELTETVANQGFIDAILDLLAHSVHRMTTIGKDERKLGSRLKDGYLLLLDFVVEGVMVPYVNVCTNTMLHTTRIRGRDRGRGIPSLPPLELLLVLQAVYSAAGRLRSTLEDLFVKSLDHNTNMIVVCREALKSALKPLFTASKEALRIWTVSIAMHIERLLHTIQVKTDYGYSFLQAGASNASTGAGRIMSTFKNATNKGDSSNSNNNVQEGETSKNKSGCTPAADSVCQALLKMVSAVQNGEEGMPGLDLHEHFYKPLGQQLVGQLISHFRRQSVTEAGAEQLHKDLEEYHRISLLFHCPEVEDMLRCLKEIAAIYSAPASEVRNVIVEDLRHLDTGIVLALSRARSDYGVIQKGSQHWTRLVASAYSLRSHRWDYELPWESASSSVRWPLTLRKTSQPVSALCMELLRGPNPDRTSVRSSVDDVLSFGENSGSGSGSGSGFGGGSSEEGGSSGTNFTFAMRSALSSLSSSAGRGGLGNRPVFMPAGPSSPNRLDHDGGQRGIVEPNTPVTSTPVAKPLSSTMSSFFSSLSPTRELDFPDREPTPMVATGEDGVDESRETEPVSTSADEAGSTTTSDRIRNALSAFGSGGSPRAGEGEEKKSAFSSFFKR